MSSLASSQDNGDGWYLQGDPVITKDEEIDLPPCYVDKTITVTNGEGHDSVKWSADCFKERSGTHSSDVTWTQPPDYMEPGSNISFSMTFTSPFDDIPISGGIYANSVMFLEGRSINPQGKITATYTVPDGSQDEEMEIYTSFILISGLHGYVTYNYKYQGAPAKPNPIPAEAKAEDTELVPADDKYCCKGSCDYKSWWSLPKSSQDSGGELPETMYSRDSGVRFSALTGQVDIRPESDEDAWRGAGLKSIIQLYDHIRTAEESRAILSFDDMTTFELKPESEIIIDTPPERDSKIALVCGKIWINFKKMLKDGSMEIQMSQAVAGIKGTTIVCEETGSSSILKVLAGTASLKSRATGEETLVHAGEMATATTSGLSNQESFDVEAEKAILEPYHPKTEVIEPEESEVIYNSWNKGSVDNKPTCSPFFTIDKPQMITYIDTYHWNHGTDAPVGTISLRNGYGKLYGPWGVETSLDQSKVPKGYWIVHPNEIILAGTYTVEDSDPATWSQNSESPCGFTKVEGYAATTDASGETDAPGTGIREPVSSAASPEQKLGKDEVGDEQTDSHGILETISSSIKKSTAAKQKSEPAFIEKSTYSIGSDRLFEIHSQAATGDFEWNPQSFAGFYYDLNGNVGTEVLTATLMDGKLSGSYPYGLTYQTTAQKNDFAFEDWGSYNVIGFMGEKYFAGYLDTAGSTDDGLFEASGSKNVLSKNRLIKLLMDDDTEMTITTSTPLTLQDGYVLSIDSIDIDGNQVTLTLSKDGNKLITKKISPSIDGATTTDKTFIYRKNFGNLRDVIIIAVHFKNAFRGADQDLATIDAVWQLSDESMDVSKGTEYGKMTIGSVTADSITMNNVDNDLILSRNKDISLMPGIGIKTADTDSLRYCIYRDITNPGTYELRGAVATDSFTWTGENFAGFYYDIDDNLKTESLKTTVTDGELAQPDGITYTTMAMTSNLAFEDWGSCAVIGFLGEK
ncbi:MAG: S-layer protein domain-containing protein, partial [Methanothrix sp.]|nr:S-layer protein domain-containing protein [Methanothrix sp.]